jgi:DnaJ family protein C protein 7
MNNNFFYPTYKIDEIFGGNNVRTLVVTVCGVNVSAAANYSNNCKKADADNMELSDEDNGESDVEYATQTLGELIMEFSRIQQIITGLESIVNTDSFLLSKEQIDEIKSSLPTHNGNLEDLQFDLDELILDTVEERASRKLLNTQIEGMFEKIFNIDDKCLEHLKKLAESEKVLGNECFKSENYLDAVRHYSNAVNIEPENPLYYTNRALSYQKLNMYENAIEDASCAVTLDVNFLKGYIILSKSYLAIQNVELCHSTLQKIPLAFQSRNDVNDLKSTLSILAKDTGNNFLKNGNVDKAISMYSIAIECTPENHLLYSNRSAAYQSKNMWREALNDAEKCVHICNTFPKGYVHMGRSQVQLKRWNDAESTVNMALSTLASTPELESITPQLNEILTNARQGKGNTSSQPRDTTTNASNNVRAEQFKERGNSYYKNEEYQDAIRFYSQAISLCPNEGSYYGNRAAAWMMLKEYKRAISDCLDGISHEMNCGQLDKLRIRHCSALAAMGNIDKAIEAGEEYVALKNRTHHDNLQALEQQLQKFKSTRELVVLAKESLEKKEFTRAKRLFQNAQAGGFSDDPVVLLGLAKSHLALEEYEDASREAQKIIGMGGNISIEAYVVRADALQATGCSELAKKHLTAALQMDPDNSMVQLKLKNLRRNISELTRIRAAVDAAMNERKFDVAANLCSEGLQIDRECKKIIAEFHARKAKAYSMLAKLQFRGGHASSSVQQDTASTDAEDPKSVANATWRRCLQDAHSSIYYDGSEASIPALFLKCEALQALERYEEAVQEVCDRFTIFYLIILNIICFVIFDSWNIVINRELDKRIRPFAQS